MIVRVNVVLNRTVVVDSDRYQQLSTTVNNNSPIQDNVHLDDQTQPTFQVNTVESMVAGHATSIFFFPKYFGGLREHLP